MAALSFLLVGWAGAVQGQVVSEPPDDAPFLAGPLTVAAVVRSNVGHDDNLFNRSDADSPEGDITAAISPVANVWLQMARARAAGLVQADIYYYKDFADLRALDWTTEGRLEVPLNRLTPFVAGSFTSTTNTQNLEINAMAKQLTGTLSLGTSVRLTDRISATVSAGRWRSDYGEQAIYDDVDLSESLDHVSRSAEAGLHYILTPLTTVGVTASLAQDRFDMSPERDSDNTFVAPFVEFKPFALISGRASIGVQSRRLLSGAEPDLTGTVIFADLTYTLLEQTRFTFQATRELEYSFFETRIDYVEAEILVGVVHQFNDAWDLGGSVGRSRLTYRPVTSAVSGEVVTYPDETGYSAGVDTGYRFRQARVGLQVEYLGRDADDAEASRQYQRTRVYSTLTYTF